LGEINQCEDITTIDLFELHQEEIHVGEIDTGWRGIDESLDPGYTRTMSRTGEGMSHGRTDDANR
jgi:hypothetical protein